MINKKNTFSLSKWLIVVIALFWISIIFNYKPWQKNLINNDVVSYYGYLPAAFIYQDLSLEFAKEDPFFFDKFWPNIAPNGGRVIKMSMGLSMLYAPFFFIGDAASYFIDEFQTGYTQTYQVCLLFSCLFYLILGLIFLRKLLLFYFSEKITSLTIASVFFGTNLIWYTTLDGLMSHGYLFSMVSIFLYLVVKWHRENKVSTAICIGLAGGLITLIRPTLILCFLIFILYDVYNKQTVIEKYKILKNNFWSLTLIILGFIIVISPQLAYWKYITGDWLFFSYVGERFYFNQPHLIEGLVGFRKGWLLYTPVMVFAILGMFYLRKNIPAFFLPVIITFFLSVYVILSWWCWWYGGSYGQRPFVDFYGILALPMACFYKQVIEFGKKSIKILITVLVLLLVTLSLFQNWQYRNDFIHYDSMSKESYFLGFFAKQNTAEWYESLDVPDYDRAKNGLNETITWEEITQIKPSDRIFFNGYNMKSISCEIGSNAELTASRFDVGSWETFSLTHLGNNKIALKADNGKYVCNEHNISGKLIANRDTIGAWETFEIIYLGKKIALKADNGKYVSVNENEPHQLMAISDTISKRELFRIHIKQ
ncbi:MAG: DUF7910 domain-containing protein [Bacteroidota bacterium]